LPLFKTAEKNSMNECRETIGCTGERVAMKPYLPEQDRAKNEKDDNCINI